MTAVVVRGSEEGQQEGGKLRSLQRSQVRKTSQENKIRNKQLNVKNPEKNNVGLIVAWQGTQV